MANSEKKIEFKQKARKVGNSATKNYSWLIRPKKN